jgi:hypothetical protein
MALDLGPAEAGEVSVRVNQGEAIRYRREKDCLVDGISAGRNTVAGSATGSWATGRS